MLLEERAYIAGIIDGEGSIMLTKFHKNQFPSPCITIASTSLELLEWIKNTSKVGHVKSKKNYNPNCHKDSYTYLVKYNDAISLLEQIEPFLIIPQKRVRAQLILNEYKSLTPRNGRYTPDRIRAKDDFYNRFMAI
ncbi:hypothetical protein HNQ80_000630 [Anaerosolibacter carboniphilus]|uniref:Homing endonuclease LAGLIDADG domain-containing protein n=1 Tax=Anaerosolibacter carboniphilus TaxID=1417629 RepID=A0A841KM76_9FIRM|nr:LAGLIDADG family homing endonuclease [Anaerosolibacter carboniphilus]MBB6214547.1 hypothetical protein [Anaerosolibacter carboniphilus]